MLKSLTNCTKNKLILNNSIFPLVKIVLPVIACSLLTANYSQDNKLSDKPPKKEDDDKPPAKEDDDKPPAKEDDANKPLKNDDTLPEPPTNCCMSGCANCVWIEYAEKLSKHFKDGGEEARKKILESITDENMRAFILMELRNLEGKNK